MTNNVKFGLVSVAIVGTLGWLAWGGIGETATYYKEIKEINAMGQNGVDKRLRVGGDVLTNSIVRDGRQVHFTLVQNDLKLNVVYNGEDPLPDTFKDGSKAVVDGKLGTDGVFYAKKLQAKCASKYEAKPVAPTTRASF
jgi:cytochrome c-type biogenesis protein CcmE